MEIEQFELTTCLLYSPIKDYNLIAVFNREYQRGVGGVSNG